MEINKLYTFLILFSTLNFSISSPAQEDKVIGGGIPSTNELSKKYPDKTFYSISSNERYTYKYKSSENTVSAYMYAEETVLCLKELDNVYIKKVWYDDESYAYDAHNYNYKGRRYPCKIWREKYKTAGIFYDDYMVMYIPLDFDSIGDKRTYEYTKEFYDVKYFTSAYFHSAYNTRRKSIEFEIPKWLELDLIEVNFENFDIQKSETTDKKGNKTITYTLNDIQAIKNEKLVSSYALSLPHILVLHKSQSADGKPQVLFNSTHDLYNWYSPLVKEIGNKSDTLQDLVQSLVKTSTSDEEKIENIFYWIQDNIRYLAYEEGIMGFKPASVQKVYHERYGDCKGMANLTCEMLKLAGFDARLTWIGTRSKPYSYDIPSLIVDNHMITTLYYNGETYFLDATENGIALGDYAHRIQGQDVLIENSESYIIDTVPEFDCTHNTREEILNLELVDDKLIGTGTSKYKGEEKNILFNLVANTPALDIEDGLMETISNSDKNISVSNITTSDLKNRNIPITLEYNIALSNQATFLSKEIYLNTDFEKTFAHYDVDSTRINDLDFHYKVDINKLTTIKIPTSYSVDYLPEPINFETDEYKFLLKFEYEKDKSSILYTKRICIKKGSVKAKNIATWNESIASLNQFYNNQIIIKMNK
ncbi:MAG: transglutaminase domain-containing protein [Bacteroidales bacterium]|nr:transglutaminase domain-containing protein [Bacteroidales bacterium]MCF8456326.1 transglutaminase domain-containing protein [Bacteroidales bacterium]